MYDVVIWSDIPVNQIFICFFTLFLLMSHSTSINGRELDVNWLKWPIRCDREVAQHEWSPTSVRRIFYFGRKEFYLFAFDFILLHILIRLNLTTYASWWCWWWWYGIGAGCGTIGTGMASRWWCGSWWWIGWPWNSGSWWCEAIQGDAHHVYNGCRLYGFQINGCHGSCTVHDLDLASFLFSSIFSSANAHSANEQRQTVFKNWNQEFKKLLKKREKIIGDLKAMVQTVNIDLDLLFDSVTKWKQRIGMMASQNASRVFILKLVEVKKGEYTMGRVIE